MSLKTWMESYYQKPADQTTEEEALDHSIRKWRGLQKPALKRHGVTHKSGWLTGEANEPEIRVNDSTCALCHHFYDYNESGERCQGCPLAKVRRGVPCDQRRGPNGKVMGGPYFKFTDDDDAKPMLTWLLRAKEAQKKKAHS